MIGTRRIATGFGFIALVLAVALTVHATSGATDHRTDPRNPRVAAAERGRILTWDGVVLAHTDDGLRVYPEGERYGHVTGYKSPVFGSVGIERSADGRLQTSEQGSLTSWLRDLLGGEAATADVVLTIDDRLQQAVESSLGDRHGAIIMMSPDTGAVIALVSQPGFDPNVLFGDDALENGERLTSDPARPLEPRATGIGFAPGSTFKVITTLAGITEGGLEPDSLLEDTDRLPLPGTNIAITNADGGSCGEQGVVTLTRALVVSCNTTFADLAMDLGAEALIGVAREAGLHRSVPFDLEVVPGFVPDAGDLDLPALAQTGIGERDLRITPLHMAMVVAAILNEGTAPRPHLIAGSADAGGQLVDEPGSEAWLDMMPDTVAADLEAMLIEAVTDGTGRSAAVSGLTVGGKTGTPEVVGAAPHAWFAGFGRTAEGETVVIVVFVESGGPDGDEISGGRTAAPIAADVLEVWAATRDA